MKEFRKESFGVMLGEISKRMPAEIYDGISGIFFSNPQKHI